MSDAERLDQLAEEFGPEVAREAAQYLLGIGSARATGRRMGDADRRIGAAFNQRKSMVVRKGYMAGYRQGYNG